MIRTKFHLFALSAFIVMACVQSASAAPQILGVLATKVPQPLLCEGGECSADLASFCLQPNRGEPWPGQLYTAFDAAELTLVGKTQGAREVRAPAGSYVRFKANVAMTSVRVTVDRSLLDELGVSQLALQVGPGVSLLPVVSPDDSDPLTGKEVALATGAARHAGADFFEDGSPIGVAARLTAALMSRLPMTGKVSATRRVTLWDDAISAALRQTSTREGIARARHHFVTCRAVVKIGIHYNMRSCLEVRHGDMVRKHNRALRKSLKAVW